MNLKPSQSFQTIPIRAIVVSIVIQFVLFFSLTWASSYFLLKIDHFDQCYDFTLWIIIGFMAFFSSVIGVLLNYSHPIYPALSSVIISAIFFILFLFLSTEGSTVLPLVLRSITYIVLTLLFSTMFERVKHQKKRSKKHPFSNKK